MNARSFADRQNRTYPHCRTTVQGTQVGSKQEHQLAEKRQRMQQPSINPLEPTTEPMLTSSQQEQELLICRSQAKEAAQRGQYTEAIEILSKLISCHPESASEYNNRGLIYFQSGQMDKAIADYNKAIQLNPGLASAYNNRANYYAAQKKLSAAIVNYGKAIDLNPVYIRAWINRGITFRDLGLYEQAIENFDCALRLGTLKLNIWAERGRTYHLMGDWNLAMADYRRALSQLRSANVGQVEGASRLQQRVESWLDHLLKPLSA